MSSSPSRRTGGRTQPTAQQRRLDAAARRRRRLAIIGLAVIALMILGTVGSLLF
jgi:hypothetical protein